MKTIRIVVFVFAFLLCSSSCATCTAGTDFKLKTTVANLP